MSDASVESLLQRWSIRQDGDRITTATSILVPGLRDDEPVMLKLATVEEEARGNRLMTWWDGRGAARVLAHSADAVLLERATGSRSLASMARAGGAADDAATRVMCEIVAHLHAVDDEPPTGLIPLQRWFRELFESGRHLSPFHARAAERASELVAAQREIVVLHGDLHHGNVLDFGMRTHSATDGWAVIDPKFLIGDRAFDFANILCNPDALVAERPGRLARQVDVIARGASIERQRLLGWTVAWCALSDSWFARDRIDAPHVRRIGEEAERMMAR